MQALVFTSKIVKVVRWSQQHTIVVSVLLLKSGAQPSLDHPPRPSGK